MTDDEKELDAIKRIIDYLQFNGFKNLEDARARGWGDTSPLTVQPDHRTEQKQ